MAAPSCGQPAYDKADVCMRHAMLLSHDDGRLPRSVQELDEMVCSKITDNIKCIGDLRRCMRPFSRTVFNVGYRNFKAMTNRVCGSVDGKKTFIEALSCFETRQERKVMFNYVEHSTSVLDWIADNSNPDQLVNRVCCAQSVYAEISRQVLTDICMSKGKSNSVDFMLEMMSTGVAEGDQFCGKYMEVSACRRDLPTETQLFEKMIKSNKVTKHDYSPLIPMLKILENLDAEKVKKH